MRKDLVFANLGNPHWMRDESQRDAVCDAYERDIESNPAHPHKRVMERIIQRVNEGRTVALYCFCAPKRCHCDFIAEYVLTNVQFG